VDIIVMEVYIIITTIIQHIIIIHIIMDV